MPDWWKSCRWAPDPGSHAGAAFFPRLTGRRVSARHRGEAGPPQAVDELLRILARPGSERLHLAVIGKGPELSQLDHV